MKKHLHFIVPAIAVLVSSFLLFTTLDDKVFDSFLRAIPSLTENESVLIVKVDDRAIEQVGLFPWTRDIMADAIVFLKEMGADSVTFDLSYLDNSPVKVDPRYVKEELPQYIDYGFGEINTAFSDVMDAFARRAIAPSDAPALKEQLSSVTAKVRDSLDTSISYVTRDVDEYFAQCLSFFGDSYLTLTMITPETIVGENKTFDMSRYDTEWLNARIALSGVEASGDGKTPEALGITPAIPTLLRKAQSAGFVNADPDPDGYRRRVHLLQTWEDRYYGQLVLVPLLKRLGNPGITVTDSSITLTGARLGTETATIKIPRAQDGSILVKWPKKEFTGYNAMSAWSLIGYNRLESVFVKNLSTMADAGFFSYWDDGDTPLERFNNAQFLREALYGGEDPANGVTFGIWKAWRSDFLASADRFLNGGYEASIIDSLDSEDTETRAYVAELFADVRGQYADLMGMRAKVSEKTKGAFCVIGVDATSMTDSGLTTFQEHFPNVGIHATIANMILSREFLDDAPAWISLALALALSLAIGNSLRKFDTRRSMLFGLGLIVGSVLVLLAFFIVTKRYVGVVVPLTSATITFISLSAYGFLTTIREKSFLRSAFSRYLSPAVINEIINDPSKLNLGGEKREMTAIFTDIRGFSTISEQLDPADLVNLLNHYLTEMSNIIMDHRGTIDKYEGDAIIAFFGAPIHMNDHATLACRTAIRMKQAEARLNERIISERLSPVPLFTRLGINTGDMIVGNMGTPNKMDYTIMGNSVNLAARLEGVNKQYETGGILISEHTRKKIGDEFLLRRLDRVRVVGLVTPLRLYELLAFESESTEADMEYVHEWEKAIDLYEKKSFLEAQGVFLKLAGTRNDDRVAQLYARRCEEFIANPPNNDWDGVFNLTHK